MSKSVCLYIVAFSLVFGVSAAANQTDVQLARESFRKGVVLYNDEHFEQALEQFNVANDLNATWKLLYNIGQCHAALRRYGLALELFEKYLGEGGDEIPVERRDEILAEMDRLRNMIGELQVSGPFGTQVYVDDILRGATPLDAPIRITAGTKHAVRLVYAGEDVLVRNVILGGGQSTTLQFEEQETEPDSMPVPEASTPPEEVAAPEPEPQPTREAQGLPPALFWAGLGGTVVFGGTALAMNFAVDAKIEEIEDDPDDVELMAQGKVMQYVGIGMLGLAAAAGVTTVLLAVFTDFDQDEEPEEPVSVRALLGPAGVGVMGRF